MTVKVGASKLPAQTELWVDEFRFLSQLHTLQQQVVLNAAHEASKRMTDAQAKSADLIARDSNGYPLWALQVIAISFRLMQSLGGRVNLLSGGMGQFFFAAKACGIYGLDEATADSEIARVMRNETPAT